MLQIMSIMVENIIKPESYYELGREEMLGFIPKGCNKILDIGCGAGHFGYHLKKRFDAEVWGIEVNPNQSEIASRLLDKVICGDVVQVIDSVPDNYFDCFIFNDSLEHLTYPNEILRIVKNKLVKNGYIIASIPNVRYIVNLKELLLDKDWRYRDEGILDNTHFRFFTKKSIIRLFTENKYEIESIKGINPTRKFIFDLINFFTLGFFSDTRYLQFAVVARKK
ncbi:MAG: class I SAM-dependent methyltransferase [Ignavibacteriae bacterium]|nr:class I SAM-dependent methyltransferase [Ignavibacteriota bacterium]